MKELRRVSVVRLVKVLPFSVLAANGDTIAAGPVWTNANTAFTCVADIFRSQIHFAREGYSLSDGIYYLPNFKPRFPEPQSTK